jgi:hypothetical protein
MNSGRNRFSLGFTLRFGHGHSPFCIMFSLPTNKIAPPIRAARAPKMEESFKEFTTKGF